MGRIQQTKNLKRLKPPINFVHGLLYTDRHLNVKCGNARITTLLLLYLLFISIYPLRSIVSCGYGNRLGYKYSTKVRLVIQYLIKYNSNEEVHNIDKFIFVSENLWHALIQFYTTSIIKIIHVKQRPLCALAQV
jgi:hypothetical protein